jgi:hypothetical protein
MIVSSGWMLFGFVAGFGLERTDFLSVVLVSPLFPEIVQCLMIQVLEIKKSKWWYMVTYLNADEWLS